jgi:hypothetical protein
MHILPKYLDQTLNFPVKSFPSNIDVAQGREVDCQKFTFTQRSGHKVENQKLFRYGHSISCAVLF